MKKIWLFALSFLLSAPCMAQQSTLDIAGIHQLVDESKSENTLQVNARNQQALATANEQANVTLLAKLKNMYRTLQQRYNSLGTAINIADIGIQATPMVNQIINYQGQIVQLAEKNPAIIALGYQTEIEFVEKAKSLIAYIIGLSASIGDVNQMKASDRKMLFDYIISELSRIQEISGTMVNNLQYATLSSLIKSVNPFQNYLNQDKSIAGSIVQNAKYLK
jgi:hypothetical protein